MAYCEYYYYQSGRNYCAIKTEEKGFETAEVSNKHYSEYCRYDTGYKTCPFFNTQNNSSSNCFLTSACVASKGLPDNCFELTTLRTFRDGWLISQEFGRELIESYYRIAPQIVKNIDNSDDAIKIYEEIYTDTICPCVKSINEGDNKKALDIYTKTVETLKKRFFDKEM